MDKINNFQLEYVGCFKILAIVLSLQIVQKLLHSKYKNEILIPFAIQVPYIGLEVM
jgi:hypothetical protein